MYPEALLAPSVLVCEGATEVGLMRGLDQFRIATGKRAITARGIGLVDGGGTNTFRRANAFLSLGYRTAVLRDSDAAVTPQLERAFADGGGTVFSWSPGNALEDELFASLSDSGVEGLLAKAVELKETALINEHIKSASDNDKDLEAIQADAAIEMSAENRDILAAAAKSGAGWFKSVGAMELVAREVIGPDADNANDAFRRKIRAIFKWTADGET
jgi:putative ATP-dependent endonuclease of OLD family